VKKVLMAAVTAALIAVQVLATAAQAGEVRVAKPMAFMSTRCTPDNGLNCFYNAGYVGDHKGHSYYAIVVGSSLCIKYWNHDWDAFHGHCTKIPGAF
jgi:hypothetical protein